MALFSKIIRPTTSAGNPLMNCKTVLEQRPARYKSCSCGDDDKSPPPSLPLIGSGNPSNPTVYDVRKYSHDIPTNNVKPYFETVQNMPSGIFRCTDGEILGLGAGKNCYYKAPEYFSYHHMSYYDVPYYLKKKRLPTPDTKRKPP